MAYYTALINAWNGATQPPTGVTGTGLTGGMTTDQKIAAVNGWTVSGAIPTNFFTTGDKVLDCINWAEFAALTATQQSNVLALCTSTAPLRGGSAVLTHILPGMIVAYFPAAGATITALVALAQATVQPWWQVPVAAGGAGLTSPITTSDTTVAGLT